jgi:large exoprotein involved in heme utilization and adhesion
MAGSISTDSINTSSDSSSFNLLNLDPSNGDVTGGDGGIIAIYAPEGDISTGNLNTDSVSIASGDIEGGDGGKISLFTRAGNVATGDIGSDSLSVLSSNPSQPSSSEVTGGDGGTISVASNIGNISTGNIKADATSFAFDASRIQGGNGGIIDLSTHGGNIATGSNLSAWSFVGQGRSTTTGAAGDIRLATERGRLNNPSHTSLQTWATSLDGKRGDQGGSVHLRGSQNISNYAILTQAASGQGGDVRIEGLGDVVVDNIQVLTSPVVEIAHPLGAANPPIRVRVGQTGQSGNVSLTSTGALTLKNTIVESTTQNDSPAGNVTIGSAGLLTLQDNTQITSNTRNLGPAGTVSLDSDTGIWIRGDRTRLSAITSDRGTAGNLNLKAPTITLDQDATLSTATTAPGTAGNIALNAETVNLFNGSEILSFSNGFGDGGTIAINATESVNLGQGDENAAPIVSVAAHHAGKPGNININTPHFTLSETARITATATETATNTEEGGSITISANTMDLAGTVGIFAETQGQAPAGTLTLQTYQNHPNLDLTLTPGAILSASTSGSGHGGNLLAAAPQTLNISGPGKLAVETAGRGNGGNLSLRAPTINLRDGIEISASTFNSGDAGNINLTATDLNLTNDALIRTNTLGSGDAGNIKVNVTRDLTIDNSSIEARTEANSTGNGGDIDIDPINTNIQNNGQIAVDSEGSGTGGDIRLVSDNLTLSNSGRITAATRSSNGGNITLTVPGWLQMQDNSEISTEAGTAQAGGDGGNITLDVGFLIGLTNSDIVTNAFSGNGGVVTINAHGIINFTIENHNTPRHDPRNNITASSVKANVGILNINGDRARAIPGLPEDPTDLTRLIDRSCTRQDTAIASSKFTLTGRGGLPPQPSSLFNWAQPLVDLGPGLEQLSAEWVDPTPAPETLEVESPEPGIVEAHTWRLLPNGQPHLVAQQSSGSRPSLFAHPGCRGERE